MALSVGEALLGTGLAGAIHDAGEAEFGPFFNKDTRLNSARYSEVLAKAIIEYLVANTEVNTTVTTTVNTDVETTVVLGVGTGTGEGTGSGSGTGTIS